VKNIVDELNDAAQEAKDFCRRTGRAIGSELDAISSASNDLLPRRLATYRNPGRPGGRQRLV
jgi:hypothetical protein